MLSCLAFISRLIHLNTTILQTRTDSTRKCEGSMSDSERSNSESTSTKEDRLPSPHSNMPLTLGPGDENSETSQSPAPPPQSVGIAQAIEEAPAAELKKLVRRLWRELPQSHPLIDAALRRPLAGPSSAAPAGNLKRKASEVCENCHQVYQVDNNEKGMCVYHPRKCL